MFTAEKQLQGVMGKADADPLGNVTLIYFNKTQLIEFSQ